MSTRASTELKARARALAARRGVPPEPMGDASSHLVLRRCGHRLALPLDRVLEVSWLCTTALPGSHPRLLGVVRTHGQVMGLVDPSDAFGTRSVGGLPERQLTAIVDTRAGPLAWAVDEVCSIVRLAPPPDQPPLPQRVARAVLWVTSDGLFVVDVDSLCDLAGRPSPMPTE